MSLLVEYLLYSVIMRCSEECWTLSHQLTNDQLRSLKLSIVTLSIVTIWYVDCVSRPGIGHKSRRLYYS